MNKVSISKLQPKHTIIGIMMFILVFIASGVVIFNTNKNTQNNIAQTTTPSSQISPKSTNTTPINPTPLVITEWDVKMPLSADIADAYYAVSKSSQDGNGQPNTMLLGLSSLDRSGCYADGPNTGQTTATGALLRVATMEKDPISGMLYTELYPNGSIVGSYYYTFQDLSKRLTCASQATLQKVVSSFSEAAKNITAN